MANNEYRTLKSVRKQVEEKLERNKTIKKGLKKAVRNIHRIDEINALLDYKFKTNTPNWASQIEELYKLQYESLNLNYSPLVKKQGRHKIFEKDRNDIVSKFRRTGIVKLRTINLNTVLGSNNRTTSGVITRKVTSDWIDEMIDWIDNQDDRLSNDEKKINDIRFRFIERPTNQEHSTFSKDILEELNQGDTFNIMNYENGEIDAAIHDIIIIDFSE